MIHTYLLLTLLCIAIQGFFAFFEMACVSFNKVRLQYYVSIGTKRALWLNYLIKSPSRLFGTTLIGITAALVIGSECSRKLYEAFHLDPDLSPITQVPLVVIFGELAPMFAARRHPEQAAMFCVPVMTFLAKILAPVIWAFDALSKLVHTMMGKEMETPLFLSREEVRMAFEEQEAGTDEFNAAVSRIFNLKNLTAGQLMIPIQDVQMIPTHATLADVRHLMSVQYRPIIPIFHRYPHNIVGIVTLRDLVPLEEGKRVIDAARSPWFVTRDTSILQLLQQFKRNNQSNAVILEPTGQAAGILTLDQILTQIFGEEALKSGLEETGHYIQRTLSGEMSVAEFNLEFNAHLPEGKGDTLSELILAHLDHLPVKGETVRIADLEFSVEEPTLRGVKTLTVHSIQE
ncbi:MAG: hemolysin family protein [Verrucomicrobia bacterium]|nr:hemolysin family protein [Verrucomicrobiota bacterium]MDE3047243.1 HlyC/CorC family transporter [Verrucomicrobiota bacterium]